MSEPVRLSRRLIELTGCSRREAELYIQGGWVRVDGEVVAEPQFQVQDQRVELHPEAVAEPVEPATLLLHQPTGAEPGAASKLIVPATRWAEDPTGLRLLKAHFARLSDPLPLEPGASGLVVFSQDWRTLRKLEEEAGRIEQEYLVEVAGQVGPWGLKPLLQGLSFQGRVLPPAKVSWQNETHLRFALKGPRPGQIAFMCEQVGLKPLAVRRLRIGRLPLAKLPLGQWRYVGPNERF